MKRYGILGVAILLVLAVVWPLFAQEAEQDQRAGRPPATQRTALDELRGATEGLCDD